MKMIFRQHDRSTFLTASRTAPESGDHIVDSEEKTCSCEGFQIRKTCQHLDALMNAIEPPEPGTLELAPAEAGEPPMKQLAPYNEFKTKIENLRKTAETITVTDISQVSEMKIARTTRLALKDIRVAITHRHKELKENILIEGRKIDAGKNELLAVLEPLELRLKDQEEFIGRETERVQAEKRAARIAEITPYLTAPPLVDLGVVMDDRYAAMLQDAKDAHAARMARELKEKEEAVAKVAVDNLRAERRLEIAPFAEFTADLAGLDLGVLDAEKYTAAVTKAKEAKRLDVEAREKQRVENERLKKEAEEREAAAKKEREEAAAKLKAEQDKARKEREAAQAKADAEAKKAKAELEALRKEQEAKAAEAEKERVKLAAAAEKQRKEAEAAQAEAQRQKDAAAKLEAARIAAEKAAAAAPKKEKLEAFANAVRLLAVPLLAEVSEVKDFSEGVERFAKWIEKKAAEIGGELL